MIALALACRPSLVIADEPTTALDVVMQAQVLQLLERLREQLGLALILISHDLGVLAETCDRIAVMYAGRIVETGPVRAVFDAPQHPYTKRLLESLPVIGGERGLAAPIPGGPPDPGDPPEGCRFRPRCPYAAEKCFCRSAAARGRARARPRRATSRPGPSGPTTATTAARRPAMSESADGGPRPRGRSSAATAAVARAVDGVSLEWRRGEILGRRRRVRLRQVDARAGDARPARARRGRGGARRRERSTARAASASCAGACR